MDSTFRSCSELKSLFGKMNYSLNIAQITHGPLFGRLIVNESPNVAVVQLKSNQGLIFNGGVNSSVINFAIESSNNIELHRVQGIPITNHTLSGFNVIKSEHYFSTSPGSDLYMIFFPKINFLQVVSQIEGEQAIEFFESENNKTIHFSKFNRILNFAKQIAHNPNIDHTPHCHDFMVLLLNSLISYQDDSKSN